MDKISTYALGVTLETLRDSFRQGKVPEDLFHPLQSLLQRITRLVAEKPISVYLFSDDANAELRDLFGYVLVRSLLEHVPSTLLVDCDFLNVGMSGIVPQKDALGFLDLLLYGSSLGVITQETSGGVNVVGAGSFPVTKKMPFVLTAFEEAARRLINYSRCAIFSGPLHEDENDIHSLVGAVDVPLLVRAADMVGGRSVDPIEEQIASQWNKEILSVRISTSGETVTAAKPTPPAPEEETTWTFEEEAAVAAKEPEEKEGTPQPAQPKPPPPVEETAPTAEREPAEPRPQAPQEERGPVASPKQRERMLAHPYKERRSSSLLPRIAPWVIAAIIVVFVIWWFSQDRSDKGVETALTEEGVTTPAETGAGEPVKEDGADHTAGGVDEPSTEADKAPEVETVGEPTQETPTPADTPADTTETPAGETVPDAEPAEQGGIDSNNILVMDELKSAWDGYFLVHVSSFRDTAKARNEVAYLEGQGFPAFIVYIDLGAKGKWYRVYVGPLTTRDEARSKKKELDDTPRVRFTRITSVSAE